MATKATITMDLTIQEAVSSIPAAPNTTITHNGFNTTASLGAASTPPVTKVAAFEKTLVAGVGTIDLTALPGTNGTTVDGTGLKVQALKVKSPSTNANILVVGKGASNGYGFNGKTWTVAIKPGEEVMFRFVDAATQPAIAGGAKTIDLSDDSAGGTDVFEVAILLG